MRRNYRKGQSTIEFIFVFFAFILFLSLSYNAVISFAVYQYLSYANFMAARAYQPSRATREEQELAALRVMQVYVPGIRPQNQNTVFSFSPSRKLATITQWLPPRPDQQNIPTVLVFKVPFLSLPLGDDMRRNFGEITLRSTVTLGREPSVYECRRFFIEFFRVMRGTTPHSAADMEDNGC